MRFLRFHKWMLNGHPGNVTRPVKRYIRRGVNHGLICTSTTDGNHAAHSFHKTGQAADMGLVRSLIGTAEGRRRMVAFQASEAKHPERYNELFGPENSACVKNGRHLTLAEGSALEDQHDNHVHGAPRT